MIFRQREHSRSVALRFENFPRAILLCSSFVSSRNRGGCQFYISARKSSETIEVNQNRGLDVASKKSTEKVYSLRVSLVRRLSPATLPLFLPSLFRGRISPPLHPAENSVPWTSVRNVARSSRAGSTESFLSKTLDIHRLGHIFFTGRRHAI